jgi:hypothetical protein
MKKRPPWRSGLFGSSHLLRRSRTPVGSWHTRWRMRLMRRCACCGGMFPTRISGTRSIMRHPGLWTRVHGPTGIPKWATILHRRCPCGDSEISWGRLNWNLCNHGKVQIRSRHGNLDLKRSAAMQGWPGRKCASIDLRRRVLRRYAAGHARNGAPNTVLGRKRVDICLSKR